MITLIDHTAMLIQYKSWANKLVFEAVAKLSPEEYVKEHENSFGSILRLLNHNYIVDLIWKAHLEGYEHGFTERNPKKCPLLEELWLLQQKLDKWYISYSEGLSSKKLNEQVKFKLTSGTHGTMTRGEILLHLVNHATYHRGFIAEIFYKVPAKPPITDLPVFLQDRKSTF